MKTVEERIAELEERIWQLEVFKHEVMRGIEGLGHAASYLKQQRKELYQQVGLRVEAEPQKRTGEP